MAKASSMQANGSMSSFLMSRKLVASPSHRRPEKLYREQTPNIGPTLSWRSREAQIIRPQHGYGSRRKMGGSFVFPPPGLDINKIKRVMFIAGGVGIK
jgi:hypothetical protein